MNGNLNRPLQMDFEEPEFTLIDEALQTLDLAETPPGLANRVMARVAQSAAQPRFRLTWMDLALTGFTMAMVGLVFLVTNTLPPQLGLYLHFDLLQWTQGICFDPWLPILSLGGAALAVGGLLLGGFIIWRVIIET